MTGARRRGVGACVAVALLWGCGGGVPSVTSLEDGGSTGTVEPGGGAGSDATGGDGGEDAAGGSAGHEAARGGAGGEAGASGTGGVAGGGDEGGGVSALAIAGTYTDDYAFTHVIDDEAWVLGGDSRFDILDFSNEGRWIVARNATTNEWNPGAYSRFDWTLAGATLWYCQTAYAAPTLAEALATAPADASDPEAGGCGGSPWSRLTPA